MRTSVGLFSVFRTVLQRDILLAWRGRTDLLTALTFFIIVASQFPFGVGADPEQLRRIGPGIVWVAALLATLLALPRMFSQDYETGVLEQLLLSNEPAVLWVLAKISAHWLCTGLPLVLVSPLLSLMYGLDSAESAMLATGLLLGTPVLSLIGAIGAALTLGLRGAGYLLALLILPLFVPILVFGVGSVDAYTSGMSARPHFMLMGGVLLACLALVPWGCAAALKVAVE